MNLCVLLAVVLAVPAASAGIVDDVLGAVARNNFVAADQYIRSYQKSRGVTPEMTVAMSWVARAELEQHKYAEAERYARQTYDLSLEQLKKRPLDREPNLPIALGAAIEVEANVLAATGKRTEAITYLQDQLQTYSASSIRTRIQKNINLLTMEGKPAPALERVSLPKGKPVLLFFWAHWCPDCKWEAPILAQLKTEYAPKGLTIIAPTQKYGYIAGGVEAPPEIELRYIEQVRRGYYSAVIDVPAPVSEQNFLRYGASTTPTLVLVDRAGIVRLYHPGAMSYPELRAQIIRTLSSGT
jgi:thiol-disulfide isomerase/thioredoxin